MHFVGAWLVFHGLTVADTDVCIMAVWSHQTLHIAKVALTMLHVTNTLAYNLSSLEPLFTLTSLRQLHLVTYGADPDDVDFRFGPAVQTLYHDRSGFNPANVLLQRQSLCWALHI